MEVCKEQRGYSYKGVIQEGSRVNTGGTGAWWAGSTKDTPEVGGRRYEGSLGNVAVC